MARRELLDRRHHAPTAPARGSLMPGLFRSNAASPKHRLRSLLAGGGVLALVAAALAAMPAPATASVASRSAYTTATPLCGVARPREVMASNKSADPAKPSVLTSPMTLGDMEIVRGTIFVVGNDGSIDEFSISGAPLRSIAIPWKRSVNSFAVDPDGALYMARGNNQLVKLNASGTLLWTITERRQLTGIFGHRLGREWVVAAAEQSGPTRLYNSRGRYVGSRPVKGSLFATAPDGGLVATDSNYVRKYSRDLRPVFSFGGAGSAQTPVPGEFDFYLQGGAVQLPDGRYLVADSGRGLEVFSSEGVLLGTMPDSQLGRLSQRAALQLRGSTLYLENGGPWVSTQTVASIAVRDVVREALAPSATPPGLGIGAGVRLGALAGYFAPGQRPAATAVFDPWWKHLSHLRLSYKVLDRVQAESGSGRTHSLALTAGRIQEGVPLRLPAAVPGPYEIDVRLYQRSKAISAQCVDYSVGAAGDALNLATLPGFNSSAGANGAVLANVFGTSGVRVTLNWSQMLPAGTSGPIDFSAYDAEIAAAAQEAAAEHVVFSVQIGSGGPEKLFVANGTWGTRVADVVAHWKNEVHYWEAWNEPNATYGSPSAYVDNVLAPFYEAVKSVEPTAQVIGGTVVGMELSYWQGIAAAGGFRYMDIAAIHPYTGHNRSFEEQGFAATYASLRALMATHGAASMPVWITEVGWWSNGPEDYFDQGDRLVRAELWMHALGIPVMEYLDYQGTWTTGNLDFSLINGDTNVKPAALAAMVEANQTAGRSFQGWLQTGIPLTYAAQFGPSSGTTMVALWTDDVALRAVIRLAQGSDPDATLVDEYGARRSVSLANGLDVRLDGAVQYLVLPAGDAVAVAPPEAFGPDLALASNGSTASASSSTQSNPPAGAIDGDATADNVGDLAGSPAWGSAYGDPSPQLTVTFPHAERIDRVLLATSSVGSIMPGIRSWNVLIESPSGHWRHVAYYHNLFYDRAALSRFRAVLARAIRIQVERVNFGGSSGGAKPWFWPASTAPAVTQPNDYSYGPAIIREVMAYAPAA
jgi:hypothetical protein